jgi:hypothetical protein
MLDLQGFTDYAHALLQVGVALTHDSLTLQTTWQSPPWHIIVAVSPPAAGAGKRGIDTSWLPAVLFGHGDADENVLYQEHPVTLAEILQSCGASSTFQRYPGVG